MTATTADGTTDVAAGPGAPANGTQTAQIIGGETTSSGSGPGFGAGIAIVAFGAVALLARRR